jgi:hypothetical protein
MVAIVSVTAAETTAAVETVVTTGAGIFSFRSILQNAFQFRIPRVGDRF